MIEYKSGEFQSIETGTRDCTADPTNITITAITVADTIPLINGMLTSENAHLQAQNATATITSTTNLRLDFGATPSAGQYNVSWQIFEYNSADVAIQSGLIALSNVEGSNTATLSPSVDTDKTFISNSGLEPGTSSGVQGRSVARLKLTSSTIVDAARSLAGTTAAMNVRYDVVEFTSGDNGVVESGVTTISDAATSANPTFTELGADSFPWNGDWRQNRYPSADQDLMYDDSFFTQKLAATPDDLTLARVASAEDIEIAWFILDLTAAVAAGNDPDTDAGLFIAGQQQPVIQLTEIVAY